MIETVRLQFVSRIVLLAAVALLAACGGKPPGPRAAEARPEMPADHPPMTAPAAVPAPGLAPQTVMARVGAEVITAADVSDALAVMPAPDRLEYTTTAMIRDLVESLADRKLMAAAARREGLDRDPAVKEMAGDAPPAGAEQMLAGAWLEAELARAPAPTEADIARYYAEHRDEFTEPARVRVTRVVAPDEAAAERARGELARGATAAGLQAARPGNGAVEELWLQDAPKKPELITVALGLKPGQVSLVLPVASGFAVMRAEERAPARVRPLDEVRAGIQATLQDSARQSAAAELRKRLRKGVNVEVVEAAVSFYLAPAPGVS